MRNLPPPPETVPPPLAFLSSTGLRSKSCRVTMRGRLDTLLTKVARS